MLKKCSEVRFSHLCKLLFLCLLMFFFYTFAIFYILLQSESAWTTDALSLTETKKLVGLRPGYRGPSQFSKLLSLAY